MKSIITLFFALVCFVSSLLAQQGNTSVTYKKTSAMIPMRDGVKLYTMLLAPVGAKQAVPILITRTPYGAEWSGTPDDSTFEFGDGFPFYSMAQEGYIFAYQDIRGKYKSEGTMQIHQPLIHEIQKGAIDESTDTYDAVDWLVKNVPNNNCKAGIVGISYPGWLALVGAVDPHPALKASSEQACMGDLFLGDDFHHNGGFSIELWNGVHV